MNAYSKYTGDTFTPAITIGGGTYAKEFDQFVAFGPVKPNEEKRQTSLSEDAIKETRESKRMICLKQWPSMLKPFIPLQVNRR